MLYNPKGLRVSGRLVAIQLNTNRTNMIPQPYIEDLLSKVDIVSLIGAHVKLAKAGKNYVGQCPFHQLSEEKCFTVTREKNFYHCFGCGAHGSAINFLIKHRGVGFTEAVDILAAQFGGEPPPTPGHQAKVTARANALSATLRQALDYYKAALRTADSAIALLKGKGISGRTAKKYEIGFAPDSWENLKLIFGPDYEKSCAEAGLTAVASKDDRVYDRLRNRIIFPTLDSQGRVLGLTGLALKEKPGVAEYLRTTRTKKKTGKNTPDPYDHRASLFGLSQANGSMHVQQFVIVVQDCLDVLRLHESGVANVVSAAETGKLKTEHVERIFRRTPHIICCFPATKRGNNRAWQAMKAVLPALTDKVQVSFAMLPDEQGPADILQMDEGKELFQLMLKSAVPLSEFLLQGLLSKNNLDGIEQRAKLLSAADELFTTITQAPNTKMLLEQKLQELLSDQLELLDSVDEHDAWLRSAIETAHKEIIIVSPWITDAGVRRFDLLYSLTAAARRGVQVLIYADIEFRQERNRRIATGELHGDGAEAALKATGAELRFVNRIHSKLVIIDQAALCIGSFNWLSAAKAGPYQRHEVSVVHGKGNIAKRKAELLENLDARGTN